MELDSKVVIVTGASSGIGEATARILAKGGARLMLAARRTDRLAALAAELGSAVTWRQTDVTKRADLEALAAETLARFGRVDAIVNNAGIMPLSFMAADRVDEWERLVDVNIKGVLFGIHAVLPTMLAQGSGHIVNVASIAGLVVPPTAAVYSGTKFFMRALSEGLRKELTGKVRVTIVYPGAVETELLDSIGDPDIRNEVNKVKDFLKPEAIAEGIAYALGQPADVAVNEIVIRPAAMET